MHIHLGCDGGLSFDEIINFVKYFDQYVVLPSLLYDPDTERRSLYGKAGCFRRCNYGCECRSLSSFMMSDDNLLSMVWDNTMKAIYHFENQTSLIDPELIQDVINNSRFDIARKLIRTL